MEHLKSKIRYNAENGNLYWLKSNNQVKKNSIAGVIDGKDGYIRVKVFGKNYLAHRLAWYLYHGKLPDNFIDHKNHNRSDNRISNLCDVTFSGNQRNISMQKNNTSGRIGVSWNKANKVWYARIRHNGKRIQLIATSSFEKAVAARIAAEKKYNYHENHGKNTKD